MNLTQSRWKQHLEREGEKIPFVPTKSNVFSKPDTGGVGNDVCALPWAQCLVGKGSVADHFHKCCPFQKLQSLVKALHEARQSRTLIFSLPIDSNEGLWCLKYFLCFGVIESFPVGKLLRVKFLLSSVANYLCCFNYWSFCLRLSLEHDERFASLLYVNSSNSKKDCHSHKATSCRLCAF